MTVAEKLQEVASHAAEGKLLLLAEGMFYKAYQEAAWLFVKHIRNYQVNSSFVKKVNTDVLSLGFPKPSVGKVLTGVEWQLSGDRIVISFRPEDFVEAEYLRWRSEVIPQPTPSRRPSGETLLVFKHAYDLVLYFYGLNRNVSREYKFSLCEKIKEEMHQLLMAVYFANGADNPSERLPQLQEAERLLVSVKIRMRVLHDLKQMSLRQFAHCAEMIADLKEELNKWESTLQCSR